MRYIITTIAAISSLLVLVSCKKAGAEEVINDGSPTNLVIQVDNKNDGTGAVAFTATALNADSYKFEFGDGNSANNTTGTASHTYTKPGNNNFVVTVTASNSSGKTIARSTQIMVNVATSGGGTGLVWSDEFETNGSPDPNKWVFEIGTGSNGWGNNELQYYTNRQDNAVVSNGVLRITAKKENFSGSAYTSSRMITKGKFEFKYGRVEARAKLPQGVGTWPAIWMLGANINAVGWPNCGEIDIMEHKGSEPNKIYGTLHYPGRSGGNADGSFRMISNASSEFHVYSVDWTASHIKIYVDNQLIHSFVNSGSVPFNHDFFIILNVAMGGTFGGSVDPAFSSSSMEIDYIRVYKN
ncbi:family 16 glycosylhydrolase [Flavihumibacter rivuli]|uniref:family 16 glycosylhydrolase n=1 Tax=Flavihumibacter rivuli TaxID=2838156 RepID=UPI001BDDF78B|nr:family 16 glycosylhydrolase [Flavihumibacter rivuli]ULQ55229.1 family 16 glycosylhydrolase [Flavihumibacter rivuli]